MFDLWKVALESERSLNLNFAPLAFARHRKGCRTWKTNWKSLAIAPASAPTPQPAGPKNWLANWPAGPIEMAVSWRIINHHSMSRQARRLGGGGQASREKQDVQTVLVVWERELKLREPSDASKHHQGSLARSNGRRAGSRRAQQLQVRPARLDVWAGEVWGGGSERERELRCIWAQWKQTVPTNPNAS